MHFQLEIGRWWVQIGRAEPEHHDDATEPPTVIDRQMPQTIYAPDYVGFVRTPDPTE